MGPLRIDRDGDGVALLTLDLPARRNAMTEELTAAWAAAMPELAADDSVRCVVVTGAGAAFSAGGDLSWIEQGGTLDVPALRDRMLPFYRTWLAIRDLPVPTIAALNGAAVGAGAALALACDLRYATPEARLSVPFTALGLHAGMATTWLLPEVAGLAVARELLFTGRAVAGTEAVTLGLVNRLFPAEAFLDDVLAVARQVASRAPLATRLTKVALAGGGPASLSAALAWESVAQPVTMVTEDLREGLQAQRERRAPRFTGR
ncbi:MAG TPA: enoyl-CoA hydratase-related protein [Mycobacteriales bacterium]|nr:enoyl-CoA hydratase-related protein [Mycobacteriales bacterium]